MDVIEVVNILEELRGRSAFSSSDKAQIESLYNIVLGRSFLRTSCNDCYHDAVIEMYLYLKKNGKMKEKSSYTLKNGVLLQLEFGKGDFYTNANLTDEVAETYLAKNPKSITLFAGYPNDWENRVKQRNNPFNQELMDTIIQSMKDNVSEASIKESLKGYLIGGKKITVKVLDAHLKEAKALIDAEKVVETEN